MLRAEPTFFVRKNEKCGHAKGRTRTPCPHCNVGKPVSVLLLCLLHNNPLIFTTKSKSIKEYAEEKLNSSTFNCLRPRDFTTLAVFINRERKRAYHALLMYLPINKKVQQIKFYYNHYINSDDR